MFDVYREFNFGQKNFINIFFFVFWSHACRTCTYNNIMCLIYRRNFFHLQLVNYIKQNFEHLL